MRILATLLLALIIVTAAIATATSKQAASAPKSAISSVHKSVVNTVQQQPVGIIDGAVNPELIPDQVAYSLLFRLLSNRRTPEEQNRAQSYLRMAFQCGACSGASDRAHINAFSAAVTEFEQRVSVLDRRAQDIWRPRPSPAAMAELNELQRRKEAIVTEIVASLPSRLGVAGMEKLRRHVNERVRRNVRIRPEHAH